MESAKQSLPKTKDLLNVPVVKRRGDIPASVDAASGTYDWYEMTRPTPGGKAKQQPQLFTLPIHQWAQAPMRNEFRIVSTGMKVEVPCTDYVNQWQADAHKVFWVGHILEVRGYRARVRYVGCDEDKYDFWMSLCSANVHHIGYAAANSCVLTPPNIIRDNKDDWKIFLVQQLIGARTLYADWTERIRAAMLKQYKFCINMRLEVVDRSNPERVAPFRIRAIIGNRMFVAPSAEDWPQDGSLEAFNADPAKGQYWYSFHSHLIFPVGWAMRTTYSLHANDRYKAHCVQVLQQPQPPPAVDPVDEQDCDARPEYFQHSPLNRIDAFDSFSDDQREQYRNLKWSQDFKLECIDPIDMNRFAVATVKKVLPDGWLMVQLDGENKSDSDDTFPVHMRSPYIFPAGFCASNYIDLQAPKGESFDWPTYLAKTRSLAAPTELFENIKGPQHDRMPFKVGMKVECVDRSEPYLICVATVKKIVAKRLLCVHFDGWDSAFDQWIDYRSFDLYPVGYCEAIGYKLTAPGNSDNTAAKRSKK